MKTLLLLIMLIFASVGFAQPQLEWYATYAWVGNSRDEPVEMVLSDSGYIYIGAKSRGNLVLKYKPDGNLLWQARANDSAGVEAIVVDRWGNAIVTGAIVAYHSNIYTSKYANSDGHIIYSKVISPLYNPNTDSGWDVDVDSSGNAYVTGWVFSGIHPNGTGSDWMTVAYKPLGDSLWKSHYNGVEDMADLSYSIDVTPGGVVYIAGRTFKDSTNRLRIIKKNYWEKIYYLAPTLDLQSTIKITVAEDEDVYVTAHMGHHEEKDAYLIKHDSSGNHEWTRYYNGPDSLEDYPVDLTLDNSGNVLVLCYSEDSLNAESMATLKYSPDGDILWVKRYQYGNIEPKALAVDSDNNVYILGGAAGFHIVKYDSNGNEQWVERYVNANWAVDIAVDNQNNIYATGFKVGANFDIVTVKYSQSIGINKLGTTLPVEFSLSQNYPNPFNPSTNIRFDIPKSGLTVLKVYDVLGKEVASLVNEKLSAGSYEIDWNASNFSSGVYFYQLQSGDFVKTKKMLFVK